MRKLLTWLLVLLLMMCVTAMAESVTDGLAENQQTNVSDMTENATDGLAEDQQTDASDRTESMMDMLASELKYTWQIIREEFAFAIWETLYATGLATLFAILIGLPLGMLLVAGEAKGILPMPAWLMKTLNVMINLLRSVPFTILIVMVIPLTRAIVGTPVGTVASIVPLTVAAFPFIARLVESSLREVNPNIIETAQSMGATPVQILMRVMLPESVPSLISNFTLAITTIMGYTAMSSTLGGGGLGVIAMKYGYYRYKTLVLFASVAVLVAITQIVQSFGTWLATKSDKRLKK